MVILRQYTDICEAINTSDPCNDPCLKKNFHFYILILNEKVFHVKFDITGFHRILAFWDPLGQKNDFNNGIYL